MVSTGGVCAYSPDVVREQPELRWTYIITCDAAFNWTEGSISMGDFYASVLVRSGKYTGVDAYLEKYNYASREWEDTDIFYTSRMADVYCDIILEEYPMEPGRYRWYCEYYAYSTSWVPLEFNDMYSPVVTFYEE